MGAVTFKASCVTAATINEEGRNTSLVIYKGLKAATLPGILMHSPGVFTEPELCGKGHGERAEPGKPDRAKRWPEATLGSRDEGGVKNQAEHCGPEATLAGDPGAVTGY